MRDIILNDKNIEEMIYEIRGKQVMLDSDLAKLYECTNGTKDINKAVKRNIERFPSDFYFQLTESEQKILWFQIGTKKNHVETRGGRFKNPHVFTEQGVAMLSSVLHTPKAIITSIKIIDAFVSMRQYISSNLIEQKYINELVLKDSKRIDSIEKVLDSFKEKTHHLFFKGQVYDAYSLLINILNKSNNEIIIIDNYIDKNILDVLRNINKKIILITDKYNNKDYERYNSQYKNIKLIINNDFHDRFIIIDRKVLYHCGASFKDLGIKCFEISKIEDNDILINLMIKIKRML